MLLNISITKCVPVIASAVGFCGAGYLIKHEASKFRTIKTISAELKKSKKSLLEDNSKKWESNFKSYESSPESIKIIENRGIRYFVDVDDMKSWCKENLNTAINDNEDLQYKKFLYWCTI